MAQPVRINRKVTLTGSNNKHLSYPVAGTLETAEFDVHGSIIWATFREDKPGACPVVVRNIEVEPKLWVIDFNSSGSGNGPISCVGVSMRGVPGETAEAAEKYARELLSVPAFWHCSGIDRDRREVHGFVGDEPEPHDTHENYARVSD